jgi:hypothetical protein
VAGLVLAVVSCDSYDRALYSMSPERMETYLAIDTAALADSLPADGFSSTTVRATIPADADTGKRTLVFTTNVGTIRGGTTVNGAQEVPVDGSGAAEVQLVSAGTPDVARIRVSVKGVASITREASVRFVPVVANDMIAFDAAVDTALADSASLSTFRVRIAAGLPAGKRTVKFTTTGGVFATNQQKTIDVEADQSHMATVRLRSPVERGSAHVTASVNGVTIGRDIQFVQAIAEEILVDAGASSIKPGAETTVTARLIRDTGVPSLNTAATFTSTKADSANVTVGTFRGFALSNAKGEVTLTWSPGQTTYRGTVVIRVTAEGSSAVGIARIIVVD